MEYLEYERQSQESEMHTSAIAENARESVYCRFTGRKLGEIGLKPRGFDPESLPEMEAENAISHAIGEDTRESLKMMQLCGRGIVRSSSLIWEGDD